MKPRSLLSLAIIALSACQQSAQNTAELAAYNAEIIQFRDVKNIQFSDKTAAHNPFADSNMHFEGLKYFPPDFQWRKNAEFVPAKKIQKMPVKDSKGKDRNYFSPGFFHFFHEKVAYQIPVLISEEEPNIFFIMFRDKTNGKSTYGGGRYIEIPMVKDQKNYILDFNLAFNPYCHYNNRFSCPIVPTQAVLDFEVTAGEKLYSNAVH